MHQLLKLLPQKLLLPPLSNLKNLFFNKKTPCINKEFFCAYGGRQNISFFLLYSSFARSLHAVFRKLIDNRTRFRLTLMRYAESSTKGRENTSII